jgi:hypothetical protein
MKIEMFNKAAFTNNGLVTDILFDAESKKYGVKLYDSESDFVFPSITFRHLCYWSAAQEAQEALGLQEPTSTAGSFRIL